MTSGFNFWDGSIWTFIITVSILFGAMLLANLLRRSIPALRRSLLPSAVLGGFIVLIADSIFKLIFGHSMFELSTLEALTYHGLGLGFIALAWRHLDGVKGKKARTDVFNSSTITVGGYLIQAIVGLFITIILYYLIGSFAAGGVLLPMGYGQGPGQAFNWGTTYMNQYGFENGTSYGLTIAAMGFVSACAGGLFYLNKLKKNGSSKTRVENAEEIENRTLEEVYGENEIPMSESLDKLTVQFGIVFLTYLVSYGSMYLIYKYLLLPAGGFLMNTVNPLLWGFNFLVGTAWASLFRMVGDKLRGRGVIKRVYTNNFMLNRISGLMFDIMVVASIASIDLGAFRYKEFWIPLLLVCVAGMLVTYWYVNLVCKKLFPEYEEEEFLAMYGMLTGTASTGIILLREIDPYYKTPASHNLIYQSLWSIVLGAPMLLLLGFVPKSITNSWISLGIFVVLFGIITVLQLRSKIFKPKAKKQ